MRQIEDLKNSGLKLESTLVDLATIPPVKNHSLSL